MTVTIVISNETMRSREVIRTFSSLSLIELTVFTSDARLRGPCLRVSCKPRELAVSWMVAVFGAEVGTSLSEESCDHISIRFIQGECDTHTMVFGV